LAAVKMARHPPGQTLQATALVHAAWLRLGADAQPTWQNRAHFFAAAAEAMRRILVENARRKKRLKHGGDQQRMDIADLDLPGPMPDEELLALDDALEKLAGRHPLAAKLVQLCFFAGLTQADAAQHVGVRR
jgi:RNA polymerase sigma factor (TIGR02999 family)